MGTIQDWFDGLKEGDEVILSRRERWHTHKTIEKIIRRTQKTVFISFGHTERAIRRPANTWCDISPYTDEQRARDAAAEVNRKLLNRAHAAADRVLKLSRREAKLTEPTVEALELAVTALGG